MEFEHKAWILGIKWSHSSTLAQLKTCRGCPTRSMSVSYTVYGDWEPGLQVNSDPGSFLCLFLGVDCKIKILDCEVRLYLNQSLSLRSLQPLANCLVAQSLSFPLGKMRMITAHIPGNALRRKGDDEYKSLGNLLSTL